MRVDILERHPRLVPAAVILLFCALAFGNTLWCGFVSDDYDQVIKNPWITDFRFLPDIFANNSWAMHGKLLNYYRPILHVFLLVNYKIFGLNPWGFHLVNLLVHFGVSLLVYMVIERMMRLHRPGGEHSIPALAAAVLFTVHPIHTESVAWICDMPTLSFSLFYMLSFYMYIGYRETESGKRRTTMLLASALSFFVAALCKETALTLPALLIAYDMLMTRPRPFLSRSRILTYAPYAAVVVVYIAIRLKVLGGVIPVQYYDGLGVYGYALNVVWLFGRYVVKLLIPVNLNVYYVFHPVSSLLDPGVIVSAAVLAAFLAFSVIVRRDRLALLGLALFVIPLLPSFYIYGIGVSVFGERYLYLPAAGFSLIVSVMLDRLSGRPRTLYAMLAVVAVITVLYTVMSVDRNRVWVDNKTLWLDTVAKAPDAAIPHYNLGIIYAEECRYDKSIYHLKAAITAWPDYVEAHNNLAASYAMAGMLDDAIREDRAALAIDPTHYKAWYNLGMDLTEKGEHTEAARAFMKAAEFGPDDPEFRRKLEQARGR